MADDVDIVIRLSELQAFIAQTRQAQQAVKQIGTGAEEGVAKADAAVTKVPGVVGKIRSVASSAVTSLHTFGTKASETGGMLDKLHATASKPLVGGGMMGQLGAMALGGISVAGIKDAITSTAELSKEAQSFHAVSGMSAKDAGAWAAVTQAAGVNSRTFGMALKATATQVSNFSAGNKTSTALMQQLGISMNDVKAHGNNMDAMFGEVVDKFNKMPAGANKTAVATKLFGRSWQTLLPLLSGGSKGMEALTKQAESMGVNFGGNGQKSMMQMRAAMVQVNLATTGLKVAFAQEIAPTLFQVLGVVVQLAGVLLKNLHPAFKILGSIVNGVTTFFKQHQTVLHAVMIVVGLLIAQWVYGKAVILAARAALALLTLAQNLGKVAMFAYKVAVLAVRAAMLIWQGTIWLVNAALDANPIAIVIIAIIALIAIIVLVITHFTQVKNVIVSGWNIIKGAFMTAINFVINFVKKNWPLLVGIFGGPIGLIIGLFFKFKSQVIQAATDVWNFMKKLPGRIVSAMSGIGNKIAQPFKAGFQWVMDHLPHPSISTGHWHGIPYPKISFATGGIMPYAGTALVGEAGPEILHLPRGASVTPLNRTSNFTTVNQGNYGGIPPIMVSVQVDRKEIARAVAKANDDIKARK